MSADRLVTRTCLSGKLKFTSRKDAKRRVKTHKFNGNFTAFYVYSCPHCDGWHLTSQPQRHGVTV